MILNSFIMIGVSLYSRIWSINFKKHRELGIPVRWHWLLIAVVLITGLAVLLIWLDRKNNTRIFITVI